MKKWYVAKKDANKNIIVVAPEEHKINFRKEIWIKEFHLISDNKKKFMAEVIKKPKKLLSRIRQVGELLPSRLEFHQEKRKYKLILDKPIRGISKGQAVVLYDSEKCIGGGVITF